MQNITIGRYSRSEAAHEPVMHDIDSETSQTFVAEVVDVADLYAGWIEGVRDDGSSWIMWLDAQGNPEIFWAQRDADGGIVGDPIMLGGRELPVLASNTTVTPVD